MRGIYTLALPIYLAACTNESPHLQQPNISHESMVSVPSDAETPQISPTLPGELYNSLRIAIDQTREMIVIPKGKTHKPFADDEAKIMLIEPKGVTNTGDITNDFTVENDQWI